MNWLSKYFTRKKYHRVTLKDDNGQGGFYDTPENIKLFLLEAEEPQQYEVSKKFINQKLYNELPDFTGF